jgi:hypothetical protein
MNTRLALASLEGPESLGFACHGVGSHLWSSTSFTRRATTVRCSLLNPINVWAGARAGNDTAVARIAANRSAGREDRSYITDSSSWKKGAGRRTP